MTEPNGSVSPPTTFRPELSLRMNSARWTGSPPGSRTRQLSTPAVGGTATPARGPASAALPRARRTNVRTFLPTPVLGPSVRARHLIVAEYTDL